MNFQAVSVGQKLIEKMPDGSKVYGGYTDAQGTPTERMKGEIAFVDSAVGQMVQELKNRQLIDSTLVIVTAKHGQSPIDPNRFVANLKNGTSPATLLDNAGYLPQSESPSNPTGIGPTEDDISLIWLADANNTQDAVNILENNAEPGAGAAIGQIFYGASLQTLFGKPGLPPEGDPRVPDIVVQPQTGAVYTGSSKKHAEHGGFAQDDTNVMLLVSNPRLSQRMVTSQVETTQVAPTILRALGLDPRSLDAVRLEGTQVLPGLFER
jgi:arylsulfatase A-like enzyme